MANCPVKTIQLTSDVEAISRRVIWFEPPNQAVADPVRFIAYAMTYGDFADMAVLRRQLTDEDLREALTKAPPGIFDPRSWAYWNLLLGRYPAPPLPERTIPENYGDGSCAED
jgi:hypothetical protein